MSQAQIKELRSQRVKAVADARRLTDLAFAEKRELRSDEDEQFARYMREVDKLAERIDQLEKLTAAEEDERDDDERDDDPPADDPPADDDEDAPPVRKRRPFPGGAEPRQGRRPGETDREWADRQRRSTVEYTAAFARMLTAGLRGVTGREARAIQADSDIVGGYMVAPQEFKTQLIKFVDNLLWIRQEATVHTVKAAQSLGAPSFDTDIDDADWTSELDTGNEDNAMTFGKRELTPRPLAKRLRVSGKLLRMAVVTGVSSADGSGQSGGAEAFVRDRLAYKFAVAQEKAFLTGSGANRPLGVFTASSRGISTSRDYSTDMTTTNFSADALIGAKYTLKPQYWGRAKWLMHRDGVAKIRKLKDSDGQYLWVPSGMASVGGFSDGAEKAAMADRLLDLPLMVSEYAPNTFTAAQYVALLGDFSFYWIADAETLMIQALHELYAAANQVGFIARQELDGMPVLEEAFVRVKTAAA